MLSKIYIDKEKLIESEAVILKDVMSKMLDKLPTDELPFMEPHLRALYFETYFLLAKGFYNAPLVLMGILLENIVKEKLFMEGIKDEELENMNFGEALKKVKPFLSDEENKFLTDKKENLRNPYAHFNKMKLSEGVYIPSWKIENPLEKLISLDKRVMAGEITEAQARQEFISGINPQPMSSKEFRPIAHIVKNMLEEDGFAIFTFLEIDKFTRSFAEKYFKPKEVI
jgi:hypothetical protein